MNYKVYKYTFPNGKIYIGVTSKPIQYRKDCGYQHNHALKTAMKECGWGNIKVTILADGLCQQDAFLCEEEEIRRNNATDPAVGYNISHGGKSTFKGLKHSEDYKRHMSDISKGKSFSEETLKRMSAAHEKEKIAVNRISDSGDTIAFNSLHDAAKGVCGYPTNIKRACDSGRQYKGFRWELKGGDLG